jgi:ABC-2 type transport system permease protein
MLSLLNESIQNASFGIYMPRFTGTIYELLSAPVSPLEIVLGYVGAATTKSMLLGGLILATARLFVPIHVLHPFSMVGFLLLTCAAFSLFGFILGLWAKSFEQLQFTPMLVITPLTFLGGAFYSIDMLPPAWRTVVLFNPIVYLISGFRWSFYGAADVAVAVSLASTGAFLLVCLALIVWIFRSGYRHLAAEVLANLLRSERVPALVRILSPVPGLEQGAQVLVARCMLLRATGILALSAPGEAELTRLALQEPAESG